MCGASLGVMISHLEPESRTAPWWLVNRNPEVSCCPSCRSTPQIRGYFCALSCLGLRGPNRRHGARLIDCLKPHAVPGHISSLVPTLPSYRCVLGYRSCRPRWHIEADGSKPLRFLPESAGCVSGFLSPSTCRITLSGTAAPKAAQSRRSLFLSVGRLTWPSCVCDTWLPSLDTVMYV